MAVTVTATKKGINAERISMNLALFGVELSLAGTYATDGFSYDLGAWFRDGNSENILFVFVSIDAAATNAAGYTIRYDYANDKFKIFIGGGVDSEMYAGTSVAAFTKLRVMAIGYNA